MSITSIASAADLLAPIDPTSALLKAASTPCAEIGAVQFDRIGTNKIVATFQTSDGERLQYLMTTGTVMALVNSAATCIKQNVDATPKDIGVP
jgi:hypothetical protein